MNTQNIDWRHTDFLDIIEQEMHITICLYDDTGEFYLGAPGQHYLPGEWPVAGDRWCNHCRVQRINGTGVNRDEQDAANTVMTRFFCAIPHDSSFGILRFSVPGSGEIPR